MFTSLINHSVYIASTIKVYCPNQGSATCSTGIPKISAGNSQVQTVLQLVFGIIAVIAVLIIVINGFRMVLSQGNPDEVRKTRDAILAAVIGLVVAISAEVIVSFVLGRV